MISADDALREVSSRLHDGLPEGTVIMLWNAGEETREVDLSIDTADFEQLATNLHVAYDGDKSPLCDALEERTVVLWRAVEAERGPIVPYEEYNCLGETKVTALLLSSREDIITLARALDKDALATCDGYSENSEDTDGPAWILWPCDATLLATAKQVRVEHEQVDGFALSYPQELSDIYRDPFNTRSPFPLQGKWSGMCRDGEMLVIHEEDAVDVFRWIERYNARREQDE